MTEHHYPAEVVAYATKVAEALKDLDSFDAGWGATYITEIRFGFEGEDAGLRLTASDGPDGFDVVLYHPKETKA